MPASLKMAKKKDLKPAEKSVEPQKDGPLSTVKLKEDQVEQILLVSRRRKFKSIADFFAAPPISDIIHAAYLEELEKMQEEAKAKSLK